MVTPLTSIDFFSDMPNGFPGLNILEVTGFKGKSQTTNLKIYRKVLVPGHSNLPYVQFYKRSNPQF